MLDPWILWSIAYILVGIALLWFVDEIPGWYKLIFIIWPILAITTLGSIIFMIVSSIYEEVEELIRYKQ